MSEASAMGSPSTPVTQPGPVNQPGAVEGPELTHDDDTSWPQDGADLHGPGLTLEQGRAHFRQELNRVFLDALIGRWWLTVESVLRRLTRHKEHIPFPVTVISLGLFALAASYVLSLLLGETTITRPAYLLSRLLWVAFTALYVLVMNAQLTHALQVVTTTITENIRAVDDLMGLERLIKQWMRKGWQLLFSLAFALIAGLWVPSMLSRSSEVDVLVGARVLHVFNYFQVGMYIYILIVVISVLLALSMLELDIYANDPSNSRVIRRIYQVCSTLTLSAAGLGAIQYFLMTISRVDMTAPLALTALIVLGLLPPLALFVTIHLSLANIMIDAKGRRLSELHAQIRHIERRSDLEPKERLEQAQLLMDYHDRIKATPNSMISFSSLGNLFASLLLPLIATILGNFTILAELFRLGNAP